MVGGLENVFNLMIKFSRGINQKQYGQIGYL